jgi:hypothetical protein
MGVKKTKNKKLHFWFLVFVFLKRHNPQKTREFFGGYFHQKPKTKNDHFWFLVFDCHLAREKRETEKQKTKNKTENSDLFLSRF